MRLWVKVCGSLNGVESTSSIVVWHSYAVFQFDILPNIPYSICLTPYNVWCHRMLSVIYRAWFCRTVRHRNDAVKFIANLHTAQHWQQPNINQTWNSQQASHSSPWRVNYGLSVVRNWWKLTALWRCRTVLIYFQSSLGHGYESRYHMMFRVFLCRQVYVLKNPPCVAYMYCVVLWSQKKCKYGEINLWGKKTYFESVLQSPIDYDLYSNLLS